MCHRIIIYVCLSLYYKSINTKWIKHIFLLITIHSLIIEKMKTFLSNFSQIIKIEDEWFFGEKIFKKYTILSI